VEAGDTKRSCRFVIATILCVALTFPSHAQVPPPASAPAPAAAVAATQETCASPEDAVTALVQAVKAHDGAATLAVLGNAAEWISSGDKVADHAAGDRFVASCEAKHAITRDGDFAKLTIGDDDFPFAFPIVKSGERWRFDPGKGRSPVTGV
jgi:hypothetical protein